MTPPTIHEPSFCGKMSCSMTDASKSWYEEDQPCHGIQHANLPYQCAGNPMDLACPKIWAMLSSVTSLISLKTTSDKNINAAESTSFYTSKVLTKIQIGSNLGIAVTPSVGMMECAASRNRSELCLLNSGTPMQSKLPSYIILRQGQKMNKPSNSIFSYH